MSGNYTSFAGLDSLLNHKMIKAGCKDTEEIKEERSSAFHWKFTGFPGNTMSQTLCQLKVSLSSDQYFNLNKTAQREEPMGRQKHRMGKKKDRINTTNANIVRPLAVQQYIFPERMECLSRGR